jgi:hypothetical protein
LLARVVKVVQENRNVLMDHFWRFSGTPKLLINCPYDVVECIC